MKITLFVPTRNELEGMQQLMHRVPKELFEQILIVDKSDDDESIKWAKSQGYDVIKQTTKGLRNAYIEGFPHAKGDYVITFSPDGNCIPEDLTKIVDKLKAGHELVIASRYMKDSGSEDDDVVTAFGNWMFTNLINTCFAGNYSDVMTIYRGYRKQLFYDLDLHLDKSYWQENLFFTIVGIEPLMGIRAAKSKIKVTSVPSFEPARIAGVRKLQIIRWGLTHVAQIVWEIFVWRPKKQKA